MKIPKATVVKVLPEEGNRIYVLNSADLPENGWVRLYFGDYPDERRLFLFFEDDESVVAFVHSCKGLPVGARYVWQTRKYKPPQVPTACPRCRYRLDYSPKHG